MHRALKSGNAQIFIPQKLEVMKLMVKLLDWHVYTIRHSFGNMSSLFLQF